MATMIRSLFFILIFPFLYTLVLDICERYYERDLSIFQFVQKIERLKKGNADSTVIMGDSRALAINFINPATPESSSYNYAFSNAGGMYPYQYFLKQLLKHQQPPEHIIWSFIPLMLTDTWEVFKDNPNPGASEFYRSARLYQFRDIFNPTPDNIFFRYHGAGKEILRNKLAISYRALRDYFLEHDNQDVLDDLFNQETGGLIFARDHRWQYTSENYLEQIPLLISDQAGEFIQNFLDLCLKHNIKVFVLNMPIPEDIYMKRQEEGFYEKYFDFMKQFTKSYPQTIYIYEKVLNYENDLFIDGSHLNENGAKYFQKVDYPQFLQWLKKTTMIPMVD